MVSDLELASLFPRQNEIMDNKEGREKQSDFPVTDKAMNWSFKREWIVLIAIVLVLACSIISIIVIAVYLSETMSNNILLDQKYFELHSRLAEYIRSADVPKDRTITKGNKGDRGLLGGDGSPGLGGLKEARGPKGNTGLLGVVGKKGTKGGLIKCDAGWIYFGKSCYLFEFKAKKNFQKAQSDCVSRGASLTKIDDMAENCFLRSLVKERNNGDLYFGLHDRGQEGKFEWVSDNSTLTFSDWGVNQPDNARTGEDCGHFWKGAGYLWNDVPCHNLYGYICEKILG